MQAQHVYIILNIIGLHNVYNTQECCKQLSAGKCFNTINNQDSGLSTTKF